MSSEPDRPGQPPPAVWQPLDAGERRVLGVLIEKAKTTPDAYPLSLNALITGCNQKSNRDPMMNLSDWDVEEALVRLRKRGWVETIVGGRVERWKHLLYDAWGVDKSGLAVLGELLLRGPQTEGELRGRAARMESLDDLDALRAALKPLAERGLVVYLSPPERRGALLTHGFHPPTELQHLRQSTGDAAEPAHPARAATPAEWERRLDETREEIARLRQEVAELRAAVEELSKGIQPARQGPE